MNLGHAEAVVNNANTASLVKSLNQYITYDLSHQNDLAIAQLLNGIDRKTNQAKSFDSFIAELASLRDFSNDEVQHGDLKAQTSLCYMAFSVQALLNTNPQYETQFNKMYGNDSFNHILNSAVEYKVKHWETCQNSYSDWQALVK